MFRSVCVLLILLTIPVLSSAAQPLPIALTSPANTTTVTDSVITFEWETFVTADEYKLILKLQDGTQKLRMIAATTDHCVLTTCTITLSPADTSDWVWRENQVYKWSVKALDAFGVTTALSSKFSFTTDMLPPPTLLGVVDNYLENDDGLLDFSWSIDARVADFRIIVARQSTGAKVLKTGWLASSSYCALTACSYIVDVSANPNGNYTWWVQIRGEHVAKVKSVKRTFKLRL